MFGHKRALLSTLLPVCPGFRCKASLPITVPTVFNIAPTAGSRGEARIRTQNPTLKMTSTKIELSFNKIGRLADLADLSELLFPANRNQQHAFSVIWLALKWVDNGMVPNLAAPAEKHGVSRRTLERVRAKMRRMGLIDYVSRFNAEWGYREGWVLSSRFERGLKQLAKKVERLKDKSVGSQDKEMLLLEFLDGARRAVADEEGQAQPQSDAIRDVIQNASR